MENIYMENFESKMITKIYYGEDLSERELRDLINRYEIDREIGEDRRWTRNVTSIVKLCGDTFAIDWEQGLTENQENEYFNQPYGVNKVECEKIIKVIEWQRV